MDESKLKEIRSVDLIELLESLCVPLVKKGTNYVHRDHDSLMLSHENGWYWFSQGKGGNAIDYLMNGPDFKMSFKEAVSTISTFSRCNIELNLSGKTRGESEQNKKILQIKDKKIELPNRNSDNKRVFAYLHKTRQIDPEFINYFIKAGDIYEDEKGNCVFLGRDKEGTIKYGTKRGTYSDVKFTRDLTGSNKSYCFKYEKSTTDTVKVFESPIDLMSYLTLLKEHNKSIKGTFISLGGVSTSGLEQYLNERPYIQKIIVATDNDEAGENCLIKIQEKFGNKKIIRHTPKTKDWNEDLKKHKTYKEEKIDKNNNKKNFSEILKEKRGLNISQGRGVVL